MNTKYPIQVLDLGFQVDGNNPKKLKYLKIKESLLVLLDFL